MSREPHTASIFDGFDDDLAARLRFVLELDALKTVLRRSRLADGSRLENTAEHSWHLAVMALVLAPYAGEPVDVSRVVAMLLVHDVVEIDAGDAFLYDAEARQQQAVDEERAADRLYGLLPDQGAELRALWEEFEARETADARFARAIDRLEPVLLNHANHGELWREHGIVAEQVRTVNRLIDDGAPALWTVASAVIEDAVARGWLPTEEVS